eukprot:1744502-Rhodomonas_salina.1
MVGCNVKTDCSDPTSLSCPKGNCHDGLYFVRVEGDGREVCISRELPPKVTVRGPEVRIEWSGSPASNFYTSYNWEAEIEQTSSSDRITVAVSPLATGPGLDVRWLAFNNQLTTERSFRVRLLRVRKSNSAADATLWSNLFDFSCECNGLAPGRSGK